MKQLFCRMIHKRIQRFFCCILLAISFLLSPLGFNSLIVNAETFYDTIDIGDTKQVTIDNAGDFVFFQFTPQEDMTVVFSTDSEYCTHGGIYNDELDWLDLEGDGDDPDFSVEYDVKYGKTYYFGAEFYDDTQTGSFYVHLAADEDKPIEDLFYLYLDENNHTAIIDGVKSEESFISIPSSYKGYNVTGISSWAFGEASGNYWLLGVDFPDTLETIGEQAFYNCRELGDIDIPDSVRSIGKGAFMFCVDIYDLSIGNNVNSIGGSAFYGCSNLQSIAFPEQVATISNYVCKNCVSLESLTLGNKVKTIGKESFNNCSSLSSVKIPDSVVSVGSEAFRDCTSLESVTFGNNLTTINELAFFGCKNLKSVVIPESVTSIGMSALGYYHKDGSNTSIKNNDFVIYGKVGTVAEAYAAANGFTFIPLSDEPASVLGDADGNGEVEIVDVTYILRCGAMMTVNIPEETLMNADVDNSGDLDVTDATFIQRYLNFILTPSKIGEPIT